MKRQVKNQDADKSTIKEVRENKSTAIIKDKGASKKEEQVADWAAGAYSVDKKSKK